jgi:hypothetical protein
MRSSFLLPALLRSCVFAAPYIVTNYVELSIYTDPGYTEISTTAAASFYTYTVDVTPDVTPFSALSTYTVDSDYTDVTVVNIVLPSGAAKKISID